MIDFFFPFHLILTLLKIILLEMGEKRLRGVGIFQCLPHIRTLLWDPASGKGLGGSCSLPKLQENSWNLGHPLCHCGETAQTGHGERTKPFVWHPLCKGGFKMCGWVSWRYGQIVKNKLFYWGHVDKAGGIESLIPWRCLSVFEHM